MRFGAINVVTPKHSEKRAKPMMNHRLHPSIYMWNIPDRFIEQALITPADVHFYHWEAVGAA